MSWFMERPILSAIALVLLVAILSNMPLAILWLATGGKSAADLTIWNYVGACGAMFVVIPVGIIVTPFAALYVAGCSLFCPAEEDNNIVKS